MMKKMPNCFLLVLALAALFFGTVQGLSEAGKDSHSNSIAYLDPKGYFKILPPTNWRMQEYPQDPRGKLAFFAPGEQIELRVLAKAADVTDFNSLLSKAKELEKQLGISMNIEPFIFNARPAIKRDATIKVQGKMQRFLIVDILEGGVLHNLQYGGSPKVFNKYYDTAWKSMLTYEPLKKEKQPSKEEIRKHEAAKWNRLAKIAIEMGKLDLAKDAVFSGLQADPGNQDLMQIKMKLDKQ